jgi:hypothetical protein
MARLGRLAQAANGSGRAFEHPATNATVRHTSALSCTDPSVVGLGHSGVDLRPQSAPRWDIPGANFPNGRGEEATHCVSMFVQT